MSRTELDLSDERLGEALSRAMHQHVRSETAQRSAPSSGVGAVRDGARRRQNTRRVALSAVCVALMAIAGAAVVNRAGSTEPTPQASQPEPPAAPAEPVVLPAFASLDASSGLAPQALYADVGGVPNGVQMPSIDVWAAGDARLVVRTWPSAQASSDEATVATLAGAPTTTVSEFSANEPWRERVVEPITIRGVAGAVEQLADDQFEFWIPSAASDGYTVVATRGLDRDAALDQVDRLGTVDGVLQPADGFTRTQQVTGKPAWARSSAYAQVSYGLDAGPFVVSWLPPVGATSVEGTLSWPGGRQTVVDGREFLIRADISSVNVQWLEPSGVVVNLGVVGTEADALELASQVRMIDQSAFTQLASSVTRWVEQELPATASIELGGLQIERRNDTGHIALCVRSAGSESQCSAAQDVNGGVIDLAVIVDGRWYAIGYRPLTEDYAPDMDELSFDLDGTGAAPVDWRSTDGGIWYVADLGNAHSSTTNLGTIIGGIAGTISRPIVPSTFG